MGTFQFGPLNLKQFTFLYYYRFKLLLFFISFQCLKSLQDVSAAYMYIKWISHANITMKNCFFLCLVTANEMWTLTILTNARGKGFWKPFTARIYYYILVRNNSSHTESILKGLSLWQGAGLECGRITHLLNFSKSAIVSVSERNRHCNCVREVLVPWKKEHNEKKNLFTNPTLFSD